MNKINILKNKYAFIIIIIAAIISIPLIINGDGGADFVFHSINAKFFIEEFLSGNLLPRWFKDVNAGCGQSVFYFYPPLAYYIITLFSWTKGISENHNLYFAGFFFFILCLSAYYCYLWLKEFVDKKAAILVAIVCILLPYNFIYNFYVKFGIGEITAFSCSIIALYYATKFAKNDNKAAIGFIFAQSMIILSNLPSAITLFPLAFFFYLLICDKNLKSLLKLLSVIILSILLCAFFLLPLYDLIDYVYVGTNHSISFHGQLNYKNNFISLFSDRTYILCLISLFMLIPSFFMTINIKKNCPDNRLKNLSYTIFALELIIVFLMSRFSSPIWEYITILQKIQFPWRLLNIQGFCFIFISSIYFQTNLQDEKKLNNYIYSFITLFLTLFIYSSEYSRFDIKDSMFAPRFVEGMRKYQDLNVLHYPAEYLPKYVNLEAINVSNLANLQKTCSQKIKLISGTADYSLKKWQSGDIEFSINATSPVTIHIGQFYFPLWQAQNLDNGYIYNLNYSDYYGLITIVLDKGSHNIKLSLNKTRHEDIARYISLMSLLLIFLYYIKQRNVKNIPTKNLD